MEAVIFGALGIFVGVIGALLGIGGGMVIVPLLVFVWGFSPQMAVGTSLFVVLLNALSGTAGYLRQQKVFVDAAIKFGIATIPGAFLGSYASEYLQGKLFFLVFGCFFVLAAVQMYRKAGGSGNADNSENVLKGYNWKLGMACSVGVGFIASILGIGGGIIHVPFMVYVLHFPVHIAIATSTCILTISSLAGVASHAFLQHINWLPAVCIGGGALIGAQLGVLAAGKTKSALLMRLTACLIFITGIKFLMTVLQ